MTRRPTLSIDGIIQWPDEVLVDLQANDAKAKVYRDKLQRVETEKTKIKRKAAWDLGIAAEEISGLRSASGNPFKIVRDGTYSHVLYAVADGVEGGETAYLCHEPSYFGCFDPQPGCGWVLGTAEARPFNTLQPESLAGAKGVEFYCRVCGMYLGHEDEVVS